jgi:hypothetical protein
MNIEFQLGALLSSFSKVLSEHINDWLEFLNISHLLVKSLDPIILALELNFLLVILISLFLEASHKLSELVHLGLNNSKFDSILSFNF